ncbi:MAG: CDC48 family AAA ATPase [Candidatus Diapherotrites archaeon]|nr:CDC48 family AAA ATPase [Candidatus Diapherotrites archaeon]
MVVNKKPKKPEVTLKIQETFQDYVGKGLVTIDIKTKEHLNLSSGDIVEVEGKKKTAGVIWPAPSQDEGSDITRLDPLVRQNADVTIGEKVIIRKADFVDAQKIVLAPSEAIRFVGEGYERMIKRQFMGRPFIKGDKVMVKILGGGISFLVVNSKPSNSIVRITPATEFEIKEEPVKEIETASQLTYEDIGGIKDEVLKVREMVELPMRHPELFSKLGIDPPKGVLLHGPPGTGKTLLAKAVANETNAHFILLNGPEIMSKFVGEAEERIREIFAEAEKNMPSIIFIDELDAIAPKRDETSGEVERRVVAQMLTLMDGLQGRGQVITIGATNRPNSIDPALRRPGRFDREIELGIPDKKARFEILQIHTRGMPLNKDVDLNAFASITHGFVGADLSALVKESAMKALRRILPKINLEEETIPIEVLEKLEVNKKDVTEALKEIQPSALREVLIEVPNVKWETVGGLENVKKALKEAVEWPLSNPKMFKRLGIRPPKGILLYGPPGCGKTLIAKAAATESEANFISIKGPEVLSKWVGESEKAIREIFRKGRQASPVIIFFDELDSIAPHRGEDTGSHVTERLVNQLLTEMDGMEDLKDVVIIGATNRPDIIDAGLLRPGRFDKMILVPSPDYDARLQILKIHASKTPIAQDVSLEGIAKKTDQYTGADLEALVREAAMSALREDINAKTVEKKHFDQALETIKPSIDSAVREFYREFAERHKEKIKKKPEKDRNAYIG